MCSIVFIHTLAGHEDVVLTVTACMLSCHQHSEQPSISFCLQVYLKHLNTEASGSKRKLKIAKRGMELWEFTRCFHGWVAEASL